MEPVTVAAVAVAVDCLVTVPLVVVSVAVLDRELRAMDKPAAVAAMAPVTVAAAEVAVYLVNISLVVAELDREATVAVAAVAEYMVADCANPAWLLTKSDVAKSHTRLSLITAWVVRAWLQPTRIRTTPLALLAIS